MYELAVAIVIGGLIHLVCTDSPKTRVGIALGWNGAAAVVVYLAGAAS